MNLAVRFAQHIDQLFPELKEETVLLACSGGVDSMVLLHLLLGEGIRPAIAHMNYGLRGAESDQDADFVADLARRENLECHLRQAPEFENLGTKSPQLWARELRYEFFEELLDARNYRAVLTAHQADDAWETYLINTIRGTGLKGLQGIPPKENRRWRPLLPFSRDEVMDFATAMGLKWREDRTNTESFYLRNYIRNRISPALRERIPDFSQRLRATQEYIASGVDLLEMYREDLWAKYSVEVQDGWSINLTALKEHKKLDSLLYLLFSPFGFDKTTELLKLWKGQTGAQLKSKEYSLTQNRESFELRRLQPSDVLSYWMMEKEHNPGLPVDLHCTIVTEWVKGNKDVLYADKQTLNFPLEVRKWQQGDYFYPSGMQGKKKIAKYFKDEKIPLPDKDKQWLLCSEGEVVWVIGRRADRRFEIKPQTKEMIKITWRRPQD